MTMQDDQNAAFEDALNSTTGAAGETAAGPGAVTIRDATADDVAAVTALDAEITGLAKPDYWADAFDRFGTRAGRYFLIADGADGDFMGFIVGEVRAWEFGASPGGWILTLGVPPGRRVRGIGTQLFDAICARFRDAGVDTVHTLVARDDALNMSFFRAQGLTAGSVIEMEKPLD